MFKYYRNVDIQLDSLDRRQVLKGISAATLIGAGILRSGVGSTAAIEARGASASFDAGHGLTWLPAWRLREMIVKREVSSVEVVDHFLERIQERDSKLHAFRSIDAVGAREQAARADKAIARGEALGPLHGVPIAFKELYSIKGFEVSATNFYYLNPGYEGKLPIAERDDIEVERLRAAGAVIVGTTIAGLTVGPGIPDIDHLPRNPWDVARTTGGSSAGSGAAVAAGLVPMAMGDDGGGSTRIPSAFCGLLGLHPTRGLIPHVDYKSAAPRPTVTSGPMVRHVRDAATVMKILAGPDGRDFVCLQDEPPDYLGALESGIKGVRFAWTDNFGFASVPESVRSPRVISAVRDATRGLEQAGGTVSTSTMTWENPITAVLAAGQLVAGCPVPGVPGSAEKAMSETEVVVALELRRRNWQRFRKIFEQVDFVASPTIQFTAPKIEDWVALSKDRDQVLAAVAAHTMMCNLLGLPAISVPAGFVAGMPVGLQIIGRPNSEARLLQVAQAFLAHQNA